MQANLLSSRLAVIAIASVIGGSDGHAQVTNCLSQGGGLTTCSTTAAPQYPSQGHILEHFSNFFGHVKDNAVRKHVGAMLAAGDCQGAGRYALSKGRLELGQQLLQSCQTYSAPQSYGQSWHP